MTPLDPAAMAFPSQRSYRFLRNDGSQEAIVLEALPGSVEIALTDGPTRPSSIPQGGDFPHAHTYGGTHWLMPTLNAFEATNVDELAEKLGVELAPAARLHPGATVVAYGATPEDALSTFASLCSSDEVEIKDEITLTVARETLDPLPNIYRATATVERIGKP